jgi:putative membrane protein
MKTRNVIIGIVAGLALLLLVGLLLGGAMWGGSDYHHGPGMMRGFGDWGMQTSGGGIVTILLWLLALGLVVGGGAYLIAALVRQDGGQAEHDGAALEILRRRYARGEINREEFQRVRETLTGQEGR